MAAWVTCAATVAVVCSLWTDWRSREVPHWVILGLVALWAVAVFASPEALGFAAQSGLVCGGLMLVLGFCLHATGWLGAGDGKLLAALALWLGPRDLGLALLGTTVLGLMLVVLAWRRPDGDFRKRGIPFAWAIAPPGATLLLARAVAT